METIRGKMSLDLDLNGFHGQLENYSQLVLDLGTGDGRYVRTLARQQPDWFVVGVDACRENLREHSRAKLLNMLFVIARAQELPGEFTGRFSHITINFPWGSLLESLLTCDPGLMDGLLSASCPNAEIEIRLNGGALTETGKDLYAGADKIFENLGRYGWKIASLQNIERSTLAQFPTTWAKRLAYGRDPRALHLGGRRT